MNKYHCTSLFPHFVTLIGTIFLLDQLVALFSQPKCQDKLSISSWTKCGNIVGLLVSPRLKSETKQNAKCKTSPTAYTMNQGMP